MKLKVLGSSSQGNCYILENESSALIIEAGVNIRQVKIALDFNLSKVAGLLITHKHLDHSKYINEFAGHGIKVFAPLDLNHFYNTIRHNESFCLDGFNVLPLEVIHDTKIYCFLIRHSEMGLCLFATDTHYLPYKIKGLNQMIIEANYDQEILDKNYVERKVSGFLRNKIIQSHMGIDTVKGIMKANDLRGVNNIVLIHLSDKNSDARRFKSEIEGLTGKKVTIADKRVEIDFNKEF